MKRLIFTFTGILIINIITTKSYGQDPKSYNPNNSSASVSLSWLNDVARLRIGGEGIGIHNGLEIQGPSNKKLLKVIDGSTSVFNPNNQSASVSLSWLNNTARLRIGGEGEGASNGFEIQRSSNVILMKLLHNGNVGIGTSTPDYKLDVLGTIRAQEIKVDLNGADFVFGDNYKLRTLEEVESFVKDNKHLPEIEPASKMEADGTDLGELNSKLLQKIEELTLYMIEQNKETKAMKAQLNRLTKENEELKEEVQELKSL